MRLPVVILMGYFLLRELGGLAQLLAQQADNRLLAPEFVASVAARVSVGLFLVMLAGFHLSRWRPIARHRRAWPKLAALAGLTLAYLLVLLPRAQASLALDVASVALILVGNSLCAVVLLSLGRALSVMPEARRLVTDGPYAVVRHPLYLAEEIAALGVFLQFRSPAAAAVLALHFYFQLQRMRWEERILAETFPEYADYQRRTWRLIPHVY
jgi:protein-S-isoprenylcysteine O-methyltransferase Ste14